MRNDPSLRKLYLAPIKEHNRPDLELTLDVREDYDLIREVIEYFQSKDKIPSLTDIIDYVDSNFDSVTTKIFNQVVSITR